MRIDLTISPEAADAILRGWFERRRPKAVPIARGRHRTHDSSWRPRPDPASKVIKRGKARPVAQLIDDVAAMLIEDGATCISTSDIGLSSGGKLDWSFWIIARTGPAEAPAFELEVRGRSPEECHKLRNALWLRLAKPASGAVH